MTSGSAVAASAPSATAASATAAGASSARGATTWAITSSGSVRTLTLSENLSSETRTCLPSSRWDTSTSIFSGMSAGRHSISSSRVTKSTIPPWALTPTATPVSSPSTFTPTTCATPPPYNSPRRIPVDVLDGSPPALGRGEDQDCLGTGLLQGDRDGIRDDELGEGAPLDLLHGVARQDRVGGGGEPRARPRVLDGFRYLGQGPRRVHDVVHDERRASLHLPDHVVDLGHVGGLPPFVHDAQAGLQPLAVGP